MTSTFHPFPRLPTELQIKIWEEACFDVHISRHTSGDHAALHYVNGGTDQSGRLVIRALDQASSDDEEGNRSAYMWDAGLWMASKQSREAIYRQSFLNSVTVGEFGSPFTGPPGGLDTRDAYNRQRYMRSFPREFDRCKAGLPFFAWQNGGIPVYNLAIEFDSQWVLSLPGTLDELKAENSARGLVANWIEGMAAGWVNAPELFLIDKSTRLVAEPTPTNPAYYDCDGGYIQIRQSSYSNAVRQFIQALIDFLPIETYGPLYEQNNPDAYDEDLDIFYDFNIHDFLNVLGKLVTEDENETN
ncbi:hypothetical protein IL306_009695 [Fusarium sp. DS 682]|nr:hypothetical protein IL306_009695 [Fusarium sp. DS 682]